MLTKVYGSAVFGVEATTITVEVNVDKGIGYHLVGLPDNAIRESNYRIAASLQNNGYKIPKSFERVHRSSIINIKQVLQVDLYCLIACY